MITSFEHAGHFDEKSEQNNADQHGPRHIHRHNDADGTDGSVTSGSVYMNRTLDYACHLACLYMFYERRLSHFAETKAETSPTLDNVDVFEWENS